MKLLIIITGIKQIISEIWICKYFENGWHGWGHYTEMKLSHNLLMRFMKMVVVYSHTQLKQWTLLSVSTISDKKEMNENYHYIRRVVGRMIIQNAILP
jgi:hypothetical protein